MIRRPKSNGSGSCFEVSRIDVTDIYLEACERLDEYRFKRSQAEYVTERRYWDRRVEHERDFIIQLHDDYFWGLVLLDIDRAETAKKDTDTGEET